MGGGGRWLVTSQDPLDMPLCVSIEQGSAVCVCVCVCVYMYGGWLLEGSSG